MKQIERIGVSLDKKILSAFDKLVAKQGYQSRSEAIRDLIRQRISVERLGDPKAEAVAAVFLVYDHHRTKLMEKLTGLQHSHHILHAHTPRPARLPGSDCAARPSRPNSPNGGEPDQSKGCQAGPNQLAGRRGRLTLPLDRDKA
jgi:Arc/MetJ-type ribon-helix-helix transcriptional regulator